VYYDLKKAAAHSLLSWTKQDIERLNSTEAVALLYSYRTFSTVWCERPDNQHPEFEEMNSIVEYTRLVYGANTQRNSGESQAWPPSRYQEVKRDWPAPAPKVKDELELIYPSPACSYFFYDISGNDNFYSHKDSGEYSPLLHIPFDPFRPLGFAFWGEERMIGYGLLEPEFGRYRARESGRERNYHDYFCAWQSILTGNELLEVGIRNKAREDPNYVWMAEKEREKDTGETFSGPIFNERFMNRISLD
jgi:hypothetical protein